MGASAHIDDDIEVTRRWEKAPGHSQPAGFIGMVGLPCLFNEMQGVNERRHEEGGGISPSGEHRRPAAMGALPLDVPAPPAVFNPELRLSPEERDFSAYDIEGFP